MLDGHRMTAALIEAGATPVQTRMALILWKVNGIESALEFVQGVKDGRAGPTLGDAEKTEGNADG